MEENHTSSSSRLKRVRKKKNSVRPKHLNLNNDDACADATLLKHSSCSQLRRPDKQLDFVAKPAKHSSCTQLPNSFNKSEKRKVKPSSRDSNSSRKSGAVCELGQSPDTSFGVASPTGNRPPMMMAAGAKPVLHPRISSIISMESSRCSYDIEADAQFMRRVSSRKGGTQKPVNDSAAKETDDNQREEDHHSQHKTPFRN
ncbi:unnamed protein product [Agarophyton chilense]